MKIGFYNPFLDSISGGEKYMTTLASYWANNHEVSLLWDNPSILKQIQTKLGIDTSRIKTETNFFHHKSRFYRLKESRKYDLLFILSDGSIPLSFASYNILHFQVPFRRIKFDLVKSFMYRYIIVNSRFTRDNIDPKLRPKAEIIYPPITTSEFGKSAKSKMILSVGRFTSFYSSKKQEVMISAFKNGYDQNIFKGYRLSLAGGLLPSDKDYYDKLTKSASGYPIDFYADCSWTKIVDLYRKSGIYWHAAGYGQKDPVLFEHFGISTVEAMAAGCIPVVFDGGGLREIVHDGVDGFVWDTTKGLIEKTGKVIENKPLFVNMGRKARDSAQVYDIKNFYRHYDRILEKISYA